MVAGNAKNGMRSLNDLLRYRSWVYPAHNENTARHWKHAITQPNNVTRKGAVGGAVVDVAEEVVATAQVVACHRVGYG